MTSRALSIASNAFGHELTEKRGVKLDSFLFDDGWDNHKSLWKFNDGFPNGFTPVKEAADKYGAESRRLDVAVGRLFDKPKQERIAVRASCWIRNRRRTDTPSPGRNITLPSAMSAWT